MKDFEYVRAATIADAIAAASPGAAYLAGGTNLLDLMKGDILRPGRVVDISRLPGLDAIDTLPDGGVRIGALVRNADLAHDPDFAKNFPAVAEALLSGASPQLRNAATAGGNLLQRTRCAYFYDTASACNKRNPGTGCGARGGETRLAAILGWSEHCIATHPSDFCVPLLALDAIIEIAGKAGHREVPLKDFYTLPGDAPAKENVLEPVELIIAVRLPAEAAGFSAHARYIKVRERTSYAFAVVAAAAALRLEGHNIVEARLALGGVAAKPWRTRAAEALLTGERPGAGRRRTFWRERGQNRACDSRRGARAGAGRYRHAGPAPGAARLPLRRPERSVACLNQPSTWRRRICATAPTSVSLSPAATAF
jgi:xanthine dehydrogenase YagS FAD-binding subunit